jgi:signal transduction histidine kinase
MRIAVKGTIAFLGVYALVLVGAAIWVDSHLRSVARTLADDTARLVGSEIAKTIRPRAVEQLVADNQETRRRLARIVDDITEHSSVIVSLAVVDRDGRVVAGDPVEPGQLLPAPDAVFSAGKRSFTSELHYRDGDYHLYVPLRSEGSLIGTLRLSMHSEQIAGLYDATERQFLFAALGGLLAVGALGLVWHVHLSRQSRKLARALEQAMHGDAAAGAGRDEFSRALGVARRLGAELSAAREGQVQASRRLAALLETMQGGVVLVGRNADLDFANPLACELLGCGDLEELAAGGWDRVRGRVAERIGGGLRPGDPFDIDLSLDGGTRRLRFQGFPLNDDADGGCLFLVKNRESMAALEKELGLAIQMRGLARFYAAFAHDLRAPLNALVLNLELLRQTLGNESPDETTRERRLRYAEVLHEELSRLNRQLDLLLGQVASSDDEVNEVDMRHLIADLVGLMEPQARRQRVTLRTELPERDLVLTGSPDRLKQAMLNIAINALEAMPDGGDLSISLAADNGHAEIRVRDTGPGIPPEVMERIYDMHFSTKSGGTGVGLYVARSVVESSGGRIAVESRAGEGTSFRVSLPVAG